MKKTIKYLEKHYGFYLAIATAVSLGIGILFQLLHLESVFWHTFDYAQVISDAIHVIAAFFLVCIVLFGIPYLLYLVIDSIWPKSKLRKKTRVKVLLAILALFALGMLYFIMFWQVKYQYTEVDEEWYISYYTNTNYAYVYKLDEEKDGKFIQDLCFGDDHDLRIKRYLQKNREPVMLSKDNIDIFYGLSGFCERYK